MINNKTLLLVCLASFLLVGCQNYSDYEQELLLELKEYFDRASVYGVTEQLYISIDIQFHKQDSLETAYDPKRVFNEFSEKLFLILPKGNYQVGNINFYSGEGNKTHTLTCSNQPESKNCVLLDIDKRALFRKDYIG